MEPTTRVGVVVTFLRMEHAPTDSALTLPDDARVVQLQDCPVAQYRALYEEVGAAHLWWLRRAMLDHALQNLLRDPRITIHELHWQDAVAGFYELDATNRPVVNLSYFGLKPWALGQHLGAALLRHAVDAAWRGGARALTVNTCTADHPNALPNYRRAGFRVIREVREEWNIPDRLGLPIPDRLRLP